MMNKCDCYHEEDQIIGWHTPVDPKTKLITRCYGTRERDECSCGGDRTKCDFYPRVRERAMKELISSITSTLRKDCPMRHENGNCLPIGGFCTSVNDCICDGLHNAYSMGTVKVSNAFF